MAVRRNGVQVVVNIGGGVRINGGESGTIPIALIPPTAISDPRQVADAAARLALLSDPDNPVDPGEWVVQLDDQTWWLTVEGPTYIQCLVLTAAQAAQLASLAGDLAALIPKAVLDANTLLKADVDDTPAPLPVAEQSIVGRLTGGGITGLTVAQALALIAPPVLVDHTAPVTVQNGGTYWFDVSGGPAVATAMVSPQFGDTIKLRLLAGDPATNNITACGVSITATFEGYLLEYDGTTWRQFGG